MDKPETSHAPWHLWVIGVLSLVWNSGGAYDYLMTQTRNSDYLAAAAQTMGVPVGEVIDYFARFPLWAEMFWALGVWGAVAGSVLLLFRSRYAFHAFVVSFAGLIGMSLYTFGLDKPPGADTMFVYVFTAAIVVLTLLLIWYARRMGQAGVLR